MDGVKNPVVGPSGYSVAHADEQEAAEMASAIVDAYRGK
jgi:hypothetical protein